MLRLSRPEPSAIILRSHGQQPQETAAHGFFRTETATLRYPLHGQAGFRQQSPRCFDSQSLYCAGWGKAGCLRIAAAETALTHAGLIGQYGERELIGHGVVSPLVAAPQ